MQPSGQFPNPAFTVLMAAYETERWIAGAIDSVLAQTREDWELIVIDDGSPDALAERVERLASDDGRVRLIRQSNRGIGAARNAGAAVACGRYLTVLDSDDALLPDYLETVGAVLDARPEVGLVSSDAHVFLETQARIRRATYLQGRAVDPPPRPDPARHLERLLDHNFIYPGATIRRSTFEAVGGFDPDRAVLGADDWQLWIRVAASGAQTVVVDRPLATYRLRLGSGSRDGDGAYRLDAPGERVLEKALREHCLSRQERLAALRTLGFCRRRARLRSAREALRGGDSQLALRLARAAFRAQPTLKGAMIVGALNVAPGALRWAHGAKGRLRQAVQSPLDAVSLRVLPTRR